MVSEESGFASSVESSLGECTDPDLRDEFEERKQHVLNMTGEICRGKKQRQINCSELVQV